MPIADALAALLGAVGPLWWAAFGLAFLASAFEASAARDPERSGGPFAAVGAVVSMITPFLLLIHAYLTVTMKQHAIINPTEAIMFAVRVVDGALLVGIVALMVFMIVAPLLPGFLIRKAAPSFGVTLRSISPVLHVIAFAVAVFASRDSVLTALLSVLRGSPIAP